MRKYPWWIKKRHNPQLGIYYKAMGQVSKTEAKKYGNPLYGNNVMMRYETEEDYKEAIELIKKEGGRFI